jgi:hypothetical protein
MPLLSLRRLALAPALVALSACTGAIGDPAIERQAFDPENPPTDPRDPSLRCDVPSVGPSPLRRLTHVEYDNAVASLLGDTTAPATSFVADAERGLFDNSASVQTVSTLLAEQYVESAVALAEAADVATLTGCDAADAACTRAFIERFGRRAYRRPLTSDEIASYVAIQTSLAAEADAETAVRGVVASFLASPHFLFRPELGESDGALRRATGWERASRLASLLWASIPDDPLLDAAAAGELDTKEGVAMHARRMLDDPLARPAIASFYEQWFGLRMIEVTSKVETVFPEYDDELRASMSEETRLFVDHVLWEGDGRLETMLTAPFTFVNAPLAELYGVSGPADAATFERVMLDPTQRAGVLTQASMLAAYARPDESSPVKRGKWVRVRVLCQDLPEPPPGIPALSEPRDGISTRERFAMHTADPTCYACHTLIDGLGFGLEGYDGIGRFRTIDRGVDVDQSGEITQTEDIDGAFEGGVELASRLASSTQVHDCAPRQWLRYQLARREQPEDLCSLRDLQEAFDASGGDLRELVVALTQTDAFLYYGEAR